MKIVDEAGGKRSQGDEETKQEDRGTKVMRRRNRKTEEPM